MNRILIGVILGALFSGFSVTQSATPPGAYDFTLEWTPRRGGRGAAGGAGDAAAAGRGGDIPTTSEPDGRTVFDALQSQLGLKLEQRKHPMDILVIDKVERVPADN